MYGELINSNVYDDKATEEMIEMTLNHLSNSLSKTLGPFGSTSLAADRTANHIVTKDGYNVLTRITYNNEVSKTIHDIIKKVSKALVKEVGDGSTSSIIVSSLLYSGIKDLQKKHKVPSKELINLLNELEKIIEKDVLKESIAINEENFDRIKDIAAVSNNNDDSVGKLIFELYDRIGADGFISLEDSDGSSDSFMINEGIEFDGGYLDRIFATEKNRIDCIYNNPYILMCSNTIDEEDNEEIVRLLGECYKKGKALIVIAKNYDFEMQNFFKINKSQTGANCKCVPALYPLPTSAYVERFEDLSLYLGTKVIDKNAGMNFKDIKIDDLGTCDKITINEDKTTIIKSEREESVDDRIEELESILEREGNKLSDIAKFDIKKRISILDSRNATLFVGGNSQIEKETRKFLMEDAIYACQSTIRHGYVIGGNLVIPILLNKNSKEYAKILIESRACKSLKDDKLESLVEDLLKMVFNSFSGSFKTVLRNKISQDTELIDEITSNCIEQEKIFNLIEHEYEDITNTKIINSSMTDIQIMKSAFSIISLLATSNQFVTINACIPIVDKTEEK